MSADDDSAAEALPASLEKCCASCGIAAIDDIKLKPCPHCDLVEYCSDKCQQDHREKHEASCKERAAELYDEILFKQPESSYLGDCPICCLPLPFNTNQFRVNVCCSKIICVGCSFANMVHENKQKQEENRCPFCRHPLPETEKQTKKLYTERAKLNDPIALHSLAKFNNERGDYESAFKFMSRAAALGDVESMYNVSLEYFRGEVVEKDRDKERALLEKAAIAGHPEARYNLGIVEKDEGRLDRAVKHWIISAVLGYEDAIEAIKTCYKDGHVSKEDFAAALRAHHDAVNEEAAEKIYHWCENRSD